MTCQVHYNIAHILEKFLYTANALSCAPVPIDCTIAEEENDTCLIHALVIVLPAEQMYCLDEYQHAQKHDPVCSKLRDCADSVGQVNIKN